MRLLRPGGLPGSAGRASAEVLRTDLSKVWRSSEPWPCREARSYGSSSGFGWLVVNRSTSRHTPPGRASRAVAATLWAYRSVLRPTLDGAIRRTVASICAPRRCLPVRTSATPSPYWACSVSGCFGPSTIFIGCTPARAGHAPARSCGAARTSGRAATSPARSTAALRRISGGAGSVSW